MKKEPRTRVLGSFFCNFSNLTQGLTECSYSLLCKQLVNRAVVGLEGLGDLLI